MKALHKDGNTIDLSDAGLDKLYKRLDDYAVIEGEDIHWYVIVIDEYEGTYLLGGAFERLVDGRQYGYGYSKDCNSDTYAKALLYVRRELRKAILALNNGEYVQPIGKIVEE